MSVHLVNCMNYDDNIVSFITAALSDGNLNQSQVATNIT